MNPTFETEMHNIISDLLRNPPSGEHPRQRTRYNQRSNTRNRASPNHDPNLVYLHTVRNTMNNFDANIAEYQRNMHNYIHNTHNFLELIQSMIASNVSSNDHIPPYTPPRVRPREHPIRQPYPHSPPIPPPRSDTANTPLSYLLFPRLDISGNRQYVAQPQPIRDLASMFQDVIIRPSEEEIDRATELFEYNSTMELTNMRCPITLEDFEEGDQICRIRQCGHCFKRTAFDGWFETSVSCPICRYDIRTFTLPEETWDNEETEADNAIQTGSTTSATITSATTDHITHPNTDELGQNVNSIIQNISSEISSVISQYVETSIEGNQNNTYHIEIPIDITREYDASGNITRISSEYSAD